MKKHYKSCITYLLPVVFFSLLSCEKTPEEPSGIDPVDGNGFFIVNEGNFNWGNGSLSFFSYDSLIVYHHIFSKLAGRPLGDVPQNVYIKDGKLYIIVNNSGRLEVIDIETMTHEASVGNLVSPRDILVSDNNLAILTSLYSDSLTVIDLSDYSIADYIDIGVSSECIVEYADRIFVSNWSGGESIVVLDKYDLTKICTLDVVKEPSEMVIDRDGNLRVICGGGYLNEEHPAIVTINPVDLVVSSVLTFEDIDCNPSELVANAKGDTLYYINNDLYMMPYDAGALPAEPLVNAGKRNFYRLGYDKRNDLIIVSDAVDYVQKGYIYIYTAEGEEIGKYAAGIIPGKTSL